MSDQENARRGMARGAGRDTNEMLNALRMGRDRLFRWVFDGVKPEPGTLLATYNALDEALREPRLSHEAVELIAEELEGTAEAEGLWAEVVDRCPRLVWIGGRQVERDEELP